MRKDPRCPRCGDKGDVDKNLRCGTCGEQLEYADADGTLKLAEKERKCPRCGAVSNKDVKHCESCGAVIGAYCAYCKSYHFIEAKVCPKLGEPIRGDGTEPDRSPMMSKILMAASFIAVLLIGFLTYNSTHKEVAQPINSINTPDTPKTPVTPFTGTARTRIDVAFVVDCTGSMGDEIDTVKANIESMIKKISSGQPRPEVRYGLVAYRDRGDEFITKKYDFSDKREEVVANINSLEADGGGDTPESVNEALHVAIQELDWDKSANTGKMLFLIGDAGPHMDYANDFNYKDEALVARKKGIKIFTIGCSGITESGESEFREIAQLSGGKFEYLTYKETYTKQDGSEIKILRAGSKTYEVTGGEKDEWREGGYAKLAAEKKAREIDLPSVAPAASAPDGMGLASESGKVAPCAPAIRAKGDTENNLDQMILKPVQEQAESQGIKYKK